MLEQMEKSSSSKRKFSQRKFSSLDDSTDLKDKVRTLEVQNAQLIQLLRSRSLNENDFVMNIFVGFFRRLSSRFVDQ